VQRPFLDVSTSFIIEKAREALQAIDPEAAAKAGICQEN
jgi:hypothetical protein